MLEFAEIFLLSLHLILFFLFVLSFYLFEQLWYSKSRLSVLIQHMHQYFDQPIPVKFVEPIYLILQHFELKYSLFIVEAVLTTFQQSAMQDAQREAEHIVPEHIEILIGLVQDML